MRCEEGRCGVHPIRHDHECLRHEGSRGRNQGDGLAGTGVGVGVRMGMGVVREKVGEAMAVCGEASVDFKGGGWV